MADGRKVNNDYLTEMADAVDPEGKTGGRQLNNELLRRISEKIGTGGGGTAPATYETMTEADVDAIFDAAYDGDGDGYADGYMSTQDVDDLVG
jgi:hypothetical protein